MSNKCQHEYVYEKDTGANPSGNSNRCLRELIATEYCNLDDSDFTLKKMQEKGQRELP